MAGIFILRLAITYCHTHYNNKGYLIEVIGFLIMFAKRDNIWLIE